MWGRMGSAARSRAGELAALVGALAAAWVTTFPATAGAAVIGFDDLDPPGPGGGSGLVVNVQYENQGVTFNDPSAFDYSEGSGAIPNFTHSPNVAVEPCVGVEFCTSPVRASFTVPQQDVRVWVGFSFPLNEPVGVRLTGFDASSTVVGTADATVPANSSPTPISTPVTINLASPAIRSLEVSVTTGGGYTGGLAVDDVEFSSIGPPPPCGATAPPTVNLDQPAGGLVVDEDSFPLEGDVAANGGPISSATVQARSLSTRTASIYPTFVSRDGGAFGPTRFGGLLDIGVNDVFVAATNCRGTGASDSHRVTRTLPSPGPHPAACVPQPDHPRVEVADSAQELADILNSDFTGQVIVPSGARFDMNDYRPLPLKSGVQLVGERGELGRRPLVHVRNADVDPDADRDDARNLFRVEGPDVCIEGLTLQGPWASPSSKHAYSHGIEVEQDPGEFEGEPEPVVIADNEMLGWPGGAVLVNGTVSFEGREAPEGYDGPRMTRDSADEVLVERNYIHHNAREGGGYGVVMGGSSYATVKGNVFDYNRHAVTSSGESYSGYYARFNYVQEGGYQYGDNGYYGSHFDVHGSMDPGHWVGGVAGEYHEIAFNTIRGDQRYGGFQGLFQQVRPALTLRGKTMDRTEFNHNIVVHEYGDAVRFKGGDDDRLDDDEPSTFNYSGTGNKHSTDYSTEIAAGDFDGDRRTDVFLSNGTGWFMSRAGIRPWEFLRPSNKLVRNLGFADIDNDGATDVLYRDGAGNLGYVKSGAAENLTPLTQVPVSIRDLRYGDFDGDGLTDIFYTRNRQWRVWYGRTQAWAPAATSSQPVAGLLFGEFDEVRGTDVAAVTRNEWSVSSGATGSWTKLNEKRAGSFRDAVAADFDGNGKTDIAFGDHAWRYSPDGRGALRTLRRDEASPNPPLHRLLVGNFNGEPRATVVWYGRHDPKNFGIWRGLGSLHSFVKLSEQKMR